MLLAPLAHTKKHNNNYKTTPATTAKSSISATTPRKDAFAEDRDAARKKEAF